MTQFEDPGFLAREYGDESRLATRRRAWNEFCEGPGADDATFEAILEASPAAVLEVGAAWGDLSARVQESAGARVIATDLFWRMTWLARQRGLLSAVADVQALPFRDRAFDVVVAHSMLYHVPDLDSGLEQIGRVLSPGGRLVATTFGDEHLSEIWALVDGPRVDLSFNSETGAQVLSRWFGRVEERTYRSMVTFPSALELRTHVASTITRSHLAERVPEFDGPFVARSAFAVFVATEPLSS